MNSKQCGNCGREISAATRVGEKCPHCGVRFDFERQSQNRGIRRPADRSVLVLIIIVLLLTLAVTLPGLIIKHHKAGMAVRTQQE